VQVNNQTEITDSEGRFVTSLENSTLYTISTGLAAICFDPILETGAALTARGQVTIEAQRRVSPAEDPCRILINGDPYVYFSMNNITDTTQTVPLAYSSLNQILSVTGQAVPPENFPPGTSGFSVLESTFRNASGLTGVWKFLGQDVLIGPELVVCADRGVPGQCEPIDPTVLRRPFEHTRAVIMRLTTQAIAAARNGKWKATNSGFSVPFLARGARSLAQMEVSFRDSKQQRFACEVVPMSCSLKRVPKKEMLKYFSGIFAGKVPKGLEHISRSSKNEVAAFQRMLRTMPETYVTCDQ
jgi:hypothetical protein